jgi:hypothetical protein
MCLSTKGIRNPDERGLENVVLYKIDINKVTSSLSHVFIRMKSENRKVAKS